MEYKITILLMFFSAALIGQEEGKAEFENVQFGFGMALNLESLDDVEAEKAGLGNPGFTLIDFRGRLSLFEYGLLEIGAGVSQFKDELPFEEAVVYTSGQLSGLPTNAKSEIVSGGWYYSLGGRAPITQRLFLNAVYGNRSFGASRKIPECSDCEKTEIAFDAGSYIRSGFSWMTFEEEVIGELDLNYTHYLDGDFQNTVTLGFCIYFAGGK